MRKDLLKNLNWALTALFLVVLLGCGRGQSHLSSPVTGLQGKAQQTTVTKAVSYFYGPGNWWMFGREPTHNRLSPFVGTQKVLVKWRFKIPEGD